MLTATITFGATAEGIPVLAAMTALGEQLATDARWNTRNPLIRPMVVPGPWKHLVLGHPGRPTGQWTAAPTSSACWSSSAAT